MSNETSPTNEQADTLAAQVFAIVRACPAGRVTTYGWIGKALGYPRGARMIGWIMNESPQGVPAQRVINSKGELSGSWAVGQKGRMRKLLENEGVVFSEDERVDLKLYGWDPSRDLTAAELNKIPDDADAISAEASDRLGGPMCHGRASPLRTTTDEC